MLSKFLPLILYLSFIAFIGWSAARQTASYYYLDGTALTGTDADIEDSLYYQPENPDAQKQLGLMCVRGGDNNCAAKAFAELTRLRPNDFLAWLRLGYARKVLGSFDEARESYQKAIGLSPNYSQPKYYMGKMLLGLGRTEESFSYLRLAGESDLTLYPELQHLARKAYPTDGHAIENLLRPESVETKRLLARYLIKYHLVTDAAKGFLLGDELNAAQKNEFVKYLIRKREFGLAREVWASGPEAENAAIDKPIFDGGFETITATDPSGLGWQIDQNMPAVAVSRDTTATHSGTASLAIKFAGNTALGRPIVSQLVFLRPGGRYTVSFFILSKEMVSAGLPAIVVADVINRKPLAASAAIQNTAGVWTRQSFDFTAHDEPVGVLSLQRPSCSVSPCPAFGDLSIDDITVTETTPKTKN